MTNLLEMKEYVKYFYGKHEIFILPVLKFLLALVCLNCINGKLGYMGRIDHFALVTMVALVCSFLPTGCIILFSAAFILLHMYALAMECAMVVLAMFLIMYLLYFRFCPADTLAVLFTPMLFLLKMPYVMPIAMGLVGTPASCISVGCGVVIYFTMECIAGNAASFSQSGAEDMASKFRFVIDAIAGNKGMVVFIVAFSITIVVVYLLRRMSIDHAWTIAMIAGALTDIVVILVGDLLYDTKVSIIGAIFSTIISAAIVTVLKFFVFNVDYRRSEHVQFEDDEYYYYVKAVPKMTVATQSKTVKKINTQRQSVSYDYDDADYRRKDSHYREDVRSYEPRRSTTERRGTANREASQNASRSAVEQLRKMQQSREEE